MSNPDAQFINRFSAIIGTLVVVAIGLIFLSRAIAAATPLDDQTAGAVAQAPVPAAAPASEPVMTLAPNAPAAAKVESGTTAQGSGGTTTSGDAEVAVAARAQGEATYQQVCSVCHGLGVAGAPKLGDAAAWASRIAQGKPALYDHALHGFTGRAGVMPPKAGRGDLSDASVQAAVDYMVAKSGA